MAVVGGVCEAGAAAPAFALWHPCCILVSTHAYSMYVDCSSLLYLAARSYTERVKLPKGKWGPIANAYDGEQRTYCVYIGVMSSPMTLDVFSALQGLSAHLHSIASDHGYELRPGGGFLRSEPGQVYLILA